MEFRPYKNIPNLLRKYRRIKGYNQKDVAKKLGLKSPSLISRWEHGVYIPGIVNAARLSVIYEVPVDELFKDHRKQVIKDIIERELYLY